MKDTAALIWAIAWPLVAVVALFVLWMTDDAALIQAIAWPLVALAALFILRKALPRIVEGLSGRVTRISVFEVSVELATVPELRTTWQAPDWGTCGSQHPPSSLTLQQSTC